MTAAPTGVVVMLMYATGQRRSDPMSAEEPIPDTTPTDPSAARLADIARLGQIALRLERAGLIVDRTSLSPAHRRALFALQCQGCEHPHQPASQRTPIGFPYPNAT
jgi:hypothetical protein